MRTESNVEPYMGSDGRLKVKLTDFMGVEHEEDLAKLVALTFHDTVGDPKDGLPSFKDGNVNNCAAENLYWV